MSTFQRITPCLWFGDQAEEDIAKLEAAYEGKG